MCVCATTQFCPFFVHDERRAGRAENAAAGFLVAVNRTKMLMGAIYCASVGRASELGA